MDLTRRDSLKHATAVACLAMSQSVFAQGSETFSGVLDVGTARLLATLVNQPMPFRFQMVGDGSPFARG